MLNPGLDGIPPTTIASCPIRNTNNLFCQILIKYAIIVNNTRDIPPTRQKAEVGSGDFKTIVFRRALTANPYKAEDRIKIRRGHRRGVVVHVHDDINAINWERNIPHFIEVLFDDGTSMMCHYSQIKRNNRKVLT